MALPRVRELIRLIWRSNTALFFLSMLAGFAVGSGCILSSDPAVQAPEDFRIVITSSRNSPANAGRLTVQANGLMQFEDWGDEVSYDVVLREVWKPEQVDSLYVLFRKNGFISLRQRYPEGEDAADFLKSDAAVTIEGRMRGTYQVVHAVTTRQTELPGSLVNILDWYYQEAQRLRNKIASSGN